MQLPCQNNDGNSSIVLIEACLKDVPGSVTDILELINAFNFNISYINTHGLTAEQAEYNQYAPILMPSVDTDPKLCAEQRKVILRRLGVGNWKIFGAHGPLKATV